MKTVGKSMKRMMWMAAALPLVAAVANAAGISGVVGGKLLASGDNKVMILSDPKLGQSMMAVEKLDPAGKPLPGDCLR